MIRIRRRSTTVKTRQLETGLISWLSEPRNRAEIQPCHQHRFNWIQSCLSKGGLVPEIEFHILRTDEIPHLLIALLWGVITSIYLTLFAVDTVERQLVMECQQTRCEGPLHDKTAVDSSLDNGGKQLPFSVLIRVRLMFASVQTIHFPHSALMSNYLCTSVPSDYEIKTMFTYRHTPFLSNWKAKYILVFHAEPSYLAAQVSPHIRQAHYLSALVHTVWSQLFISVFPRHWYIIAHLPFFLHLAIMLHKSSQN